MTAKLTGHGIRAAWGQPLHKPGCTALSAFELDCPACEWERNLPDDELIYFRSWQRFMAEYFNRRGCCYGPY